jgi:CheY-like chemotaxis protein
VKNRAPLLLAEDHEEEVLLLRYAFGKARIQTPIVVVRDGEEAVSYLCGKGPYANRTDYPFPCMVMTDLKMPRLDGFDLLAWMGKHGYLEKVPAVVISGSGEKDDEVKARELGARAYYVKPSTLEQLIDVARDLHQNWLKGHCN